MKKVLSLAVLFCLWSFLCDAQTAQNYATVPTGTGTQVYSTSPQFVTGISIGTANVANHTLQTYQNTANDVTVLFQNAYSGNAQYTKNQANSNYSSFQAVGASQTWGLGQNGYTDFDLIDVTHSGNQPFSVQANSAEYMQIKSNGAIIMAGTLTGVGIGTTAPATNAMLDVRGPVKLFGYTVATLPTGSVGMIAYVTDQLTACVASGAALTGGGSVTCPVFYNGSAWVGN